VPPKSFIYTNICTQTNYVTRKHNYTNCRHDVAINFNQECVNIFAVAQLVEALRYKPESRCFDSRWLNPFCRLLTEISTRNISLGVKATGAWCWQPVHLADFLEIWEPQPPGTLKCCPGP
jgi:hypothetical protein